MGVCWRHIGNVLGYCFCGVASRVALIVRGSRLLKKQQGTEQGD
ncbi:hypothetical protein CORC01_08134 [Colletotrichum orchidophilum]|uniref:Uncharacterized protein n=1 Tax=Colletotrichum orchidophilum TaxID=1209926 RepID=A0A1G4B5C3_9PEZI|nr:uncharacterized protein CORC01_08134 [Colletotrichum orchidophilum]OHE96536.1 hypothetical protein CORC01_08134 [Colletotrichum orchidophilum]